MTPHALPAESPCPCCDSRTWTHRWDEFVLCRTCGLLAANRRYGLDQMRRLYGSAYFRGDEYADYLADKPIHRKTLQHHLRRVRRYVPSGGRILEIGCAHGLFLDLIRGTYPGSVGVDISAEAVAHARRGGLQAIAGDLMEIEVPGEFDAVCLWDTIEHLSRPAEVLAKARGHLHPGGLLFLTTGDFGAALARIRGRHWRQIHPPTHMFCFTRRSLLALCGKLHLTPVGFSTEPVYRRLRSSLMTLRRLGGPSPAGRLAELACRLVPDRALDCGFPLDLGDTVCMVARAAAP